MFELMRSVDNQNTGNILFLGNLIYIYRRSLSFVVTRLVATKLPVVVSLVQRTSVLGFWASVRALLANVDVGKTDTFPGRVQI